MSLADLCGRRQRLDRRDRPASGRARRPDRCGRTPSHASHWFARRCAIDIIGIRLTGTGLATGEITFAGLEQLAAALRLLTLRLGRHLTEHDGAGRTPAVVERASELRLRGLRAGSTVLDVAVGEEGVLGDGLEQRTVDALFEILVGVTDDTPPAWTTPAIGEATVAVLDALASNGTGCEFTGARSGRVRIAPQAAMRSPWELSRERETRRDVSVSGRLEMLDLGHSTLRIRDMLGHAIVLRSVADTAAVTDLVGELVTATGDAVLGPRGQVVSLERARISPLQLPGWAAPDPELRLSAQPVVGALDDLDDGVDDDDIDALLARIRG